MNQSVCNTEEPLALEASLLRSSVCAPRAARPAPVSAHLPLRHRCSAPLSALGALRAPLRCLRTAQHAPLLCLRAARSAARSALRARAFRAEGADAFAAFAAAAAVAAPAAAERALTSAAAAAAEAWAGVPTAAASVAIAAAASPCASFSSFSFCLRLRARRCCVVSASLPGLVFFAAALPILNGGMVQKLAVPARFYAAHTSAMAQYTDARCSKACQLCQS